MLDIKAEAMDPVAAAEVVFEQAAEGRFYLLTQPEYVGSAMAERAEVLVSQRAPVLRTSRRFDPAHAMTASRTRPRRRRASRVVR